MCISVSLKLSLPRINNDSTFLFFAKPLIIDGDKQVIIREVPFVVGTGDESNARATVRRPSAMLIES